MLKKQLRVLVIGFPIDVMGRGSKQVNTDGNELKVTKQN